METLLSITKKDRFVFTFQKGNAWTKFSDRQLLGQHNKYVYSLCVKTIIDLQKVIEDKKSSMRKSCP